ncbi:MAG TPA: PAS domain-containing protein [Candidatus Angelobacter sp.]|nr:PAS domain-containing protein [Candidatus Angelobacter sp.]
MESEPEEKAQHELQALKLYYDTILGTLEAGVLVIDQDDIVISGNQRILKLWELNNKMEGQKLQNTEFWQRCPELKQYLEESRKDQPHSVQFECHANPATMVGVTIKPIVTESGSALLGTLLYMENVTPRVTLQRRVEDLETTAEELQSTNEELETTNEELQSTNEELETTNEELQSLNEDLETTNEELSSRTRALDEVNARYSEMMERMPWPVFLVDQKGLIYMFNSAAQKLFGFAEPSERGMKLEELPMDNRSRQAMLRRHRSAVQTQRQTTLCNLHLVTNRFDGETDAHFTPLPYDRERQDVIVMFEVQPGKAKTNTRAPRAASAKKRKKSGAVKKKRKSGR